MENPLWQSKRIFIFCALAWNVLCISRVLDCQIFSIFPPSLRQMQRQCSSRTINRERTRKRDGERKRKVNRLALSLCLPKSLSSFPLSLPISPSLSRSLACSRTFYYLSLTLSPFPLSLASLLSRICVVCVTITCKMTSNKMLCRQQRQLRQDERG